MTSKHTKGKHTTLCIIKKLRPVADVNVSMVPSFDFGKSLGEKYPLLRLIFNYLPYDDLESCSEVNDLWNMYAVETLNTRKVTKPGWFFLDTVLTLRNKLPTLVCNGYYDMSCGLLFCKPSFHPIKSVCFHKGENFTKMNALEAISKHFVGKDIPFILCYCMNVEHHSIGIISPMTMSGFLIPKIPSVIVERFSGIEDQFMEMVNERIFQENLVIRALFAFSVYKPLPRHVKPLCFVDQILKKQKGNLFALCGGMVTLCKSDLMLQGECPTSEEQIEVVHCLAIAVPLESTNFEAYSAVIDEGCGRVDTFLTRLKNRIILKKNSIAFGCFSTPVLMDAHGWYLDQFSTYFPNITTTFIEVTGEYCWDKLEPEYGECRDETSVHQYTLAVIILTWD